MAQRNQQKKLNAQQQQAIMEKLLAQAAQDLSPQSCPCGCSTFQQGIMVKFITKERLSLLGGPATNVIFQTPQLACIKCGEPFQEPKEEVLLS